MSVEERRQVRTQAERKADSARDLIRAAMELIAEQGWERSSNAEIARRAGYSSTMVNARYGSREGLLAALLEACEKRFERGGTRRDSGLEELLERIEILREEVRGDPRNLCLRGTPVSSAPIDDNILLGTCGR
jgi:AcrR family transcriptional regulator